MSRPKILPLPTRRKVAISDRLFYALGWFIQQTPNGNIIWHDGGTSSFGAYVGMVPDRNVGVIVLTNETNVGFPDAIGLWTFDRMLDNPEIDHVANALKTAKTKFEMAAKLFARPANPRAFPPLAPLAGNFVNPSFGKAVVAVEGDALVMEIQATGAKLKLEPLGRRCFHGQADAARQICRNRGRSRPSATRIRPISDRQRS